MGKKTIPEYSACHRGNINTLAAVTMKTMAMAMMMMMICYRRPAWRWRYRGTDPTADRVCTGDTVNASFESFRQGWLLLLWGYFKICWAFKGKKYMLPHPFQFPVHSDQSCTPAVKPGRDLGRPSFSAAFFLTILSQVCSLSHLSMCHFSSTFPLMHMLKNNFQILIVTRRDVEKEGRERARNAIGCLWWVKDSSISLAWLSAFDWHWILFIDL